MNLDEFIENVAHYYLLYDQGLKKQANKYIEDYVQTISAWDRQKLNDVLFRFAQELCDIKICNGQFFKISFISFGSA